MISKTLQDIQNSNNKKGFYATIEHDIQYDEAWDFEDEGIDTEYAFYSLPMLRTWFTIKLSYLRY